jgi:hypothetical protein
MKILSAVSCYILLQNVFEFEYSPRYYTYTIQLLFLKIIIHANEITQ